jgi:prevent-host-death family protein
MRIAPIAEIKAQFNAFVEATEEGPVVVTKNGKPVAVLLGITDEDEIERLILAYSPKFQAMLDAAASRIRKTGGIRHEDFWKAVETETN